MPKFSPQQSLVQFSTGLWSAGTAVSSTQAQPGGCLKSVQLLGPHGCYRENAWVNGVTTYWGGALSFLGSGSVMSDLGRTRRFFKLTKQLPKLSRASVVSSPYPVHFLDLLGFLSQSSPFPRLDWPASTVASWVLLCMHPAEAISLLLLPLLGIRSWGGRMAWGMGEAIYSTGFSFPAH